MSNLLLNVSDKLAVSDKERLSVFNEMAKSLGLDYIVVGATARDLVMVHGYGASIQRATHDIDFAVQVKSWSGFQSIKKELLNAGFSESRSMHRFYDNNGGYIDLVPFGGIATPQHTIAWPPSGNPVMSVLGFPEAYENSIPVCISNNPEVIVPVVSSEGFVLLKLVAWNERPQDIRKKDAQDIFFILNEYHLCPEVIDAYYSQLELIEEFDAQLELACAYLLGRAVRRICLQPTKTLIQLLLNENIEQLAMESSAFHHGEQLEKRLQYFYALQDGFELRRSRYA